MERSGAEGKKVREEIRESGDEALGRINKGGGRGKEGVEGPISGGDRVEPGLGRAVGCTPMDMLLLGRWVELGKERRRHQPGVCF